MTTFEESLILAWLLKQTNSTRGEIEATLIECRASDCVLEYFLGRASEFLGRASDGE